MAFCMPCNRVFKDDGALSMHLQSNRTHQEPAVVSIQKCVRCDLDFNGPGELALHVLVSERHFVCMECVADGEWQDFLTKRALKNHAWAKHRVDAGRGDGEKSDEKKKNSKGKKKGKAKETTPSVTAERETPLDEFFTSFAGFKYDPRLSPEASWKLLQAFKGWENRSKLYGPKSDAWAQYQKALVREVEMWFGDETDLTAWRTLCKAVGCFDPPDDIRKCKAVCFSVFHCEIALNKMRRLIYRDRFSETRTSILLI